MHDGRPVSLNREAAETVAIAALSFVASDPNLLGRFLAITGLAPQQIRQAASEPGFLAGVLQFILAHEPTLQAFATATDTRPADVAAALRALPFGEDSHERSV